MVCVSGWVCRGEWVDASERVSVASDQHTHRMDAVSVEAHALIARFLDRSGYRDSLAAFARDAKHGAGIDVEQLLASECSQPTAAAATSTDIRDLVERFQSASLARQLKPRQDDDAQGTLEQSLAQLRVDPRLLPRRVTRTIRDASNVLSVQHVALPRRTFDSASGRCASTPGKTPWALTETTRTGS